MGWDSHKILHIQIYFILLDFINGEEKMSQGTSKLEPQAVSDNQGGIF